MKVLLTGATGYIGNSLISYLLENNIEIRAFIRSRSFSKINKEIQQQVDLATGDVTDISSINGKLNGIDAVIYVPGLIREFPQKGITFRSIHFEGVKNLVDEAIRSNVRRFILISANGVRPNAPTTYLSTKFDGEEYLKKSKLNWSILRPSVIFGNESKGYKNFINVLVDLFTTLPFFVPVIGSGDYRFQPIALNNLSEMVVKCLHFAETNKNIYHLCGKEIFTYNQILDILANYMGKKKNKLHLPVVLLKFISSILGKYEWFPITRDQIIMLLEENICRDDLDVLKNFNIKPILFSEEFQNVKS